MRQAELVYAGDAAPGAKRSIGASCLGDTLRFFEIIF
jgi:hypothetical protein